MFTENPCGREEAKAILKYSNRITFWTIINFRETRQISSQLHPLWGRQVSQPKIFPQVRQLEVATQPHTLTHIQTHTHPHTHKQLQLQLHMQTNKFH